MYQAQRRAERLCQELEFVAVIVSPQVKSVNKRQDSSEGRLRKES